MPVLVKSRYDYEAQKADNVGIGFDPKKNKNDRSLTNQADMDSADINKIMAQYEKTGLMPGLDRQPIYADVSSIPDYHTSLSAVRRAEQYMSAQPPSIRNRFQNDPQALLDFLKDEKNNEEAVKLGLKEHDVLLTATGKDGTKVRPQDLDAWNAAVDKKAADAAKGAAPAAPAGPVPPAQ